MPLTLTDELTHALDRLESGGHLFLTGKAGTGKSTLIRHFMATTERRVVVAAPTGIAALNVDGYTIHRLFGFLATTTLDDVRRGSYRPGRFTRTLRALQTLIIDEASMVRADTFDLVEAALRRFGPREGEPFGGVQVVLVGDLLQLPPVVEDRVADYFSTHYASPYFYSAHAFDRDAFPTVELTTVFRQLADDRLTGLLNAVREGVLVEAARSELNERVDVDFVPPPDELWLTLAPSNRIVTARNRQRLELLDTPSLSSDATEAGDLRGFDPPTDRQLQFKVGAQVMMLTNDLSDRWVNGTLARIVAVRTPTSEDPDWEVDVERDDGTVVTVEPHTWEVTQPVVDGGTLRREIVGTYRQLPFKLAWAITIHKSQGQTLDRLIVDLTGGVFATGQLYVALSRCTSIEGLVLRKPVEPRHLRVDRRVVRFLRFSAERGSAGRHCALACLFVGDEGTFSRPRPVEIAVAFDDGTTVSTLVNPERDLADARTRYGISADDVLLAPTLPQAWAVLAPLVDGMTPVGAGVDDALAKIDFELKRLRHVVSMPFGTEVSPAAVHGSALERARAALGTFAATGAGATGTCFEDTGDESSLGEPSYLLSRDADLVVPSSDRLPTLSTLVEVSDAISGLLLRGDTDVRTRPPRADVTGEVVATRLTQVAGRASRLSDDLVARLRRVEAYLEVSFVDHVIESVSRTNPGAHEVFQPGARVCFTGTAVSPSGRVHERESMMRLAEDHGLVPVANVTKTRCDVLVVAEAGTQSGKARKARDYDKPVVTADEFFAWIEVRDG